MLWIKFIQVVKDNRDHPNRVSQTRLGQSNQEDIAQDWVLGRDNAGSRVGYL